MQFGEVPVGSAEGAILVHSLRFGKTALKKGRVLSAADLAEIAAAGIDEITVVRLEPGDVREDQAAARIAAAVPWVATRVKPRFTRSRARFTAAGLSCSRTEISALPPLGMMILAANWALA